MRNPQMELPLFRLARLMFPLDMVSEVPRFPLSLKKDEVDHEGKFIGFNVSIEGVPWDLATQLYERGFLAEPCRSVIGREIGRQRRIALGRRRARMEGKPVEEIRRVVARPEPEDNNLEGHNSRRVRWMRNPMLPPKDVDILLDVNSAVLSDLRLIYRALKKQAKEDQVAKRQSRLEQHNNGLIRAMTKRANASLAA